MRAGVDELRAMIERGDPPAKIEFVALRLVNLSRHYEVGKVGPTRIRYWHESGHKTRTRTRILLLLESLTVVVSVFVCLFAYHSASVTTPQFKRKESANWWCSPQTALLFLELLRKHLPKLVFSFLASLSLRRCMPVSVEGVVAVFLPSFVVQLSVVPLQEKAGFL